MKRTDTEIADRKDLHDKVVELCLDWEAFASYYHSKTFTDDVHLFGALVREYHEMLAEAHRVRDLIKRFETECIATHDHREATYILTELFKASGNLSEESAQIGGVAKKGIASVPTW